jgi:hypothetical protein
MLPCMSIRQQQLAASKLQLRQACVLLLCAFACVTTCVGESWADSSSALWVLLTSTGLCQEVYQGPCACVACCRCGVTALPASWWTSC